MLESESPLGPLIDSPDGLRREFRRRNSLWELKKISQSDLAIAQEDGWVLHKALKTATKVQRERNIDERLENKWWVLLYRMGYVELNQGRQFKIILKRREGVIGKKQIDVFARDDETVIVTECKASDRLRQRSLQKDIEEFGSIKGDISAAIKKYYGAEFRPKILWFFVTENIIWSDADIDRAKANRILRVTENELPYYTQLAEHLGRAARFQFLAEFLKDQSIPELENIKIPASRGKLGGEYFYTFVTTARHLLKISFVNHRTLADPEGYPTYQRLIQKSRLKEIGDFINAGGYFPTNLLVNFNKAPRFDILQKDLASDTHHGHMYLPSKYKSAWIIDGQHRLYGYANLEDKFLDHKVIVVAFEGLKKEVEANLFVTINHEQKPVSKTLLDDLEGQLKWGSDDPTERIGSMCARVIQQLNRDLSSPFYNRFTAEGIRSTEKSSLTIPQIKSALRRSGLLGKTILKGVYEPGALCGQTDNATVVRAQRALNGFFGLIQSADISRWDKGRPGHICSNEGVQAFCLLLGEFIEYFYKSNSSVFLKLSEQQLLNDMSRGIEPILDFIKGGGTEVDKAFVVPFGSGGPKEYLMRLARLVRRNLPDFSPGDYSNWEIAQSTELRTQADQRVQEIQSSVSKHVFKVFKVIYGEEKDAYWEKGVTNKEMQINAIKKSLEYEKDDRLPLETYLDFIELKKIVESRERWKIFKEVFDIPEPGVKGQAKNVEWMERINELRRISAHRSEGRNYKADDFPFIERIFNELSRKLQGFDYSAVQSASVEG